MSAYLADARVRHCLGRVGVLYEALDLAETCGDTKLAESTAGLLDQTLRKLDEARVQANTDLSSLTESG